MGRAIAGVIVGYVGMAGVVFVLFTLAYLALGASGSFKPDSYDVSTTWVLVSIVVGLLAGVAGGYVCALISKLPKPPLVLALIVLVLGVLSGIPVLLDQSEPGPRTGEVSNFEAMTKAKQPAWIVMLNPILGVVGVLLGARLKRTDKLPS
jgi:hypothetical protein